MAKFKRKYDTDFNVDKPVVICAKGPSFDVFQEFYFPDCYIAAVTTTVNHIKVPVDFLFFNDIEAYKQIEKESFNNVSNVICPISLHEDTEPSSEYTSSYIKLDLEDKDLNIFTHRLYTQKIEPKINKEEQDAFMAGVATPHSTVDTALSWFSSLGFYKFILFGVSEKPEYSDKFGKKKEKAFVEREAEWYKQNFMAITNVIKYNNLSVVLIQKRNKMSYLNCVGKIKPTIELSFA